MRKSFLCLSLAKVQNHALDEVVKLCCSFYKLLNAQFYFIVSLGCLQFFGRFAFGSVFFEQGLRLVPCAKVFFV
jgi:hypothetical protein